LVVPSGERQHRLRRQPQLVRDGHADAAIADVQGEIAGMRGDFQPFAPDFQLTTQITSLIRADSRKTLPNTFTRYNLWIGSPRKGIFSSY
jgi:hypothetical protein